MKYFSRVIATASLILAMSATSHAGLVRLDAVPSASYSRDFSSFSILYEDLNANGLFEIGELKNFSGLSYYWTGPEKYVDIIVDAANAENFSAGIDRYWYFINSTTGLNLSVIDYVFSYSEVQISEIPEPGTLALMAAAFAAAGFTRRRSRSTV